MRRIDGRTALDYAKAEAMAELLRDKGILKKGSST